MADNEIKFIIAVTCFNNEDEVLDFAKQLEKQTLSQNIHLSVTYNSGKRFEYLSRGMETLCISNSLSNPGQNLGYLPGCLHGVTQGELDENTWIMISNTDIAFVSPAFFENILDGIDADTWVVGPNITLKGNGHAQNPFYNTRLSKISILSKKIFFSKSLLFNMYFSFSSLKNRLHPTEEKKELESEFVYAVHGSCFMISSDMFKYLQKYLKYIFMYEEELFVSEIAFSNDKKCFFNSAVSIIHNENQTTGKIQSKTKQQWFKTSINNLYDCFYRNKVGDNRK